VVLLTPSGSFTAESETTTTNEACNFLDFEDDAAGNNDLLDFLEDTDDNSDAAAVDEVSQIFDDFENQQKTQQQPTFQIPMIPVVALPLVPLMPTFSSLSSMIPKVVTSPLAAAQPCTPFVSIAPNAAIAPPAIAPPAIARPSVPLTRRQRVLRWQAKRHKRTWGKCNPKNEYYGLRKKTAAKRKRAAGKFSGSNVSWVSA